jgi:hypothetical protein
MCTILFVRVITCRTGKHCCVVTTPVSPTPPSVADKLLLRNPPPPPPRQPLSNISLGAVTCRRNRQYCPVGCMASIAALLHRRRRSLTSTRRALLVILLAINIFFSFSRCRPVAYDVSWLLRALLPGVWAHSGRMMAAAAIVHQSSIAFT